MKLIKVPNVPYKSLEVIARVDADGASRADSSTNMLESCWELIHQGSPDISGHHEELGPAPASDPRPGVRSNNTSTERFPVQFRFSSIQSPPSSSLPLPLGVRVRVSLLRAWLSEDVDAHVRTHLYELAIFNPLKRADAVLRWTPERA